MPKCSTARFASSDYAQRVFTLVMTVQPIIVATTSQYDVGSANTSPLPLPAAEENDETGVNDGVTQGTEELSGVTMDWMVPRDDTVVFQDHPDGSMESSLEQGHGHIVIVCVTVVVCMIVPLIWELVLVDAAEAIEVRLWKKDRERHGTNSVPLEGFLVSTTSLVVLDRSQVVELTPIVRFPDDDTEKESLCARVSRKPGTIPEDRLTPNTTTVVHRAPG